MALLATITRTSAAYRHTYRHLPRELRKGTLRNSEARHNNLKPRLCPADLQHPQRGRHHRKPANHDHDAKSQIFRKAQYSVAQSFEKDTGRMARKKAPTTSSGPVRPSLSFLACWVRPSGLFLRQPVAALLEPLRRWQVPKHNSDSRAVR